MMEGLLILNLLIFLLSIIICILMFLDVDNIYISILFSFIISVVSLAMLISTITTPNYEMIDVEYLGTKMCEEHNLTFDKYEMVKGEEDLYPKIYCIKEQSIEDGYLVLNN